MGVPFGDGPTTYPIAPFGADITRFGAVADDNPSDARVTLNTAAFNAAIQEVGAAGGGFVFMPPGLFRTSAPIVFDQQNVSLVGSGRDATKIQNLTSATFQLGNVGGTANPNNLKLRHFQIDARGGHAVEVLGTTNIGDLVVQDCHWIQTGTGSSIYYQNSTNANLTDSVFRDCVFEHVSGSTVPAIYWRGAAYNEVVIERCRWINSSHYFMYVENTSASGWCTSIRLRDINASLCRGGVLKALGVTGLVVDSVNPQENITYTDHIFQIGPGTGTSGPYPNGVGSLDNVFRNIIRSSGTLTAGKRDIYVSGGAVDSARTKKTLVDTCRSRGGSAFNVDFSDMEATALNMSAAGTTFVNTASASGYPVAW